MIVHTVEDISTSDLNILRLSQNIICRHRTYPHFINGKFRPLLKPSAAELVSLERMRTQLESHILAVNLMTCQVVSRRLLLPEPGCSLE